MFKENYCIILLDNCPKPLEPHPINLIRKTVSENLEIKILKRGRKDFPAT
jgi:hypothetical protein